MPETPLRLELVHEFQGNREPSSKSVCLITRTEQLDVRSSAHWQTPGITISLPGPRHHTLHISNEMLDEIVRQRDALRLKERG
jgi:hypothetical protein